MEPPLSGAGVSLAELLRALEGVSGVGPLRLQGEQRGDLEALRLRDVFQDAGQVTPGSLFVARAGRRRHGAEFASSAMERGAAAIVTDHAASLPADAGCVVRCAQPGRALAAAARLVYGDPSAQLPLVGVTGTNGKTSVVWALQHALSALGRPAARLGTLGYQFREQEKALGLTTPEADATQRLLRSALNSGAAAAVMEVSSSALVAGRTEGLSFVAGALTNLTPDHLDQHGTMQAYGQAKALLFRHHRPGAWVLNTDDDFGRQLAREHAAAVGSEGDADVQEAAARLLRVGTRLPVELERGALRRSAGGLAFQVNFRGRAARFESSWLGAHNAENLSLALGVLLALGAPLESAAEALGEVPAPPGRLESCHQPGDPIQVLVDYAHTEDALARVLAALRPHCAGRLICVFGCGGERDPSKRAPMGRAAARGADRCVLTSDNPRGEDPLVILAEVERGLVAEIGRAEPSGQARYTVEPDRAQAIALAVQSAQPGDVVLLAGKGHERQQLLASGSVDFDDREHARAALARRRGGS